MARERENGVRAKCPRRIEEIPLGLPRGVSSSHGTDSAYQPMQCARQGLAAGVANVSPQRLRAEIPGAAAEPTLLQRSGMPEGASTLAGGQASAEAPRGGGRAPAACRGGTAATPTEGNRGQGRRGRFGRGKHCRRASAWSRGRKTSAGFLRPAGLLRACAGIALRAGFLLWRRVPHSHESSLGPRAQVLAA